MIHVRSRIAVFVAMICALALGVRAQPAPGATSDQGSSWVSAPAQPPATPLGAQPPPYPVPIGYVGDIQFWTPNRGLLITAGNAIVPGGLYAYDGVSWHQLSTVCGGTDGRIAWAGPDEFWTIADQRPGQVLPSGGVADLENVSLCHFLGGQVVASYALPLDQQDSYKTINAAACDSSADCWFGGALDSSGAFHLHWDGTSMTEVDGPQDQAIASMALYNGQIYESVQLDPNGDYGSGYTPVLHLVVPSDTANPFHNLYPDDEDPSCGAFCPPLPDYGADSTGTAAVPPQALSGFALSSDTRTRAADPQLWAAAGIGEQVLADQGTAHPIVLLYADGTWTQVVGAPNPNNPTSPNLVLPDGDVPVSGLGKITPVAQSVAAEPNEAEHAAWVAVLSPSDNNNAHVLRIQVSRLGTGKVSGAVTDNDTLGLPQGVAPAGPASAITCPAAADCWLATSEGWLFHLTDGAQLAQDTDPNFAGVITYRPPDGGTPSVIPPVELGASITPPPIQSKTQPPTRRTKPKPLVTHVHAHLIHRTVLVLSFTLAAKAHVQLIGRRHGRVVARSKHPYLKKGRHSLKLHLNAKHWPTKLALNAVPVGAAGGGAGGTSSGGT